MPKPTKKDQSYGIIPLRRKRKGWEVLFVKHRAGHWAFPKGHASKGETPIETAQRELTEETGLSIKQWLPGGPFEEHYFFSHEGYLIDKKVEYYLAEVEGISSPQLEEIEEVRWVALDKAAALATYPEAKRLCNSILVLLHE